MVEKKPVRPKQSILDALHKELEPDTKGHEAGQQGMPPLDAERDPHELPISARIEQKIQAAAATLEEWQNQARKDFAERGSNDPGGDFHTASKSAEANFASVVQTRGPELEQKSQNAKRRRTDFGKFREDHNLTRREPNYPNTSTKSLMIGVLMCLFVVESFANAVFLAKGNELGILGAYTVAFGISALNILSGFLLFGPVSRYIFHVSQWRRALAGFLMLIYVGFVFVLNLGVAHYREVSADLISEAGVAVVQRMREAAFGLQDAESWLLFGLGFLFSIIAFLEGRWFDDVYPKYGERHRAMLKARKEHQDDLKAIYDELDDIREETIDTVKRTAHEARKLPERRRQIADYWKRKIKDFDEHASHLQKVGEALIDEYREANRSARPDNTTPKAHQIPWRLPIPEIFRDDLVSPDGDSSSEERLRWIDEQSRLAIDSIYEGCQAAKDSLTPATSSGLAQHPGNSQESR